MARDPLLGFFEVNKNIYWDKASAFMAATTQNLNMDSIHWNFNDQDFSAFDWTVEPPGQLRDYYYARAKQLREKYDYLILNCSGGSDSTTMLYAFVNQGLFVDEIFVRHAEAGTKHLGTSDQNFGASNEHSEFEYAALPLIRWLNKVSPRTKVTVHDFSLDIIDDKLTWDENFIHWCGDYATPGCIVRYTHASDKDSLNLFDKGKSVGILFGTDKPKIVMDDENNLRLMFREAAVSSALPAAVNNGWTNTSVELFYWHPDAKLMMAKQCHTVKRWLEEPNNRRMQHVFHQSKLNSAAHRTAYEVLVKGIVYPDYDLATFQCDKPVKNNFQEWDYWMTNFSETAGFKTYVRGMVHLYKNINHEFFNWQDDNALSKTPAPLAWKYKMVNSNRYLIGKLNTV